MLKSVGQYLPLGFAMHVASHFGNVSLDDSLDRHCLGFSRNIESCGSLITPDYNNEILAFFIMVYLFLQQHIVRCPSPMWGYSRFGSTFWWQKCLTIVWKECVEP